MNVPIFAAHLALHNRPLGGYGFDKLDDLDRMLFSLLRFTIYVTGLAAGVIFIHHWKHHDALVTATLYKETRIIKVESMRKGYKGAIIGSFTLENRANAYVPFSQRIRCRPANGDRYKVSMYVVTDGVSNWPEFPYLSRELCG